MQLQRHPGSSPSPVKAVEALATRLPDGKLSLVFSVSGDIGRMRVPPVDEPMRTEGLWRGTCFEAFVRPELGGSYFEFNFAPSRRWAAYRFGGYRSGMTPVEVPPPVVNGLAAGSRFGLVTGIEIGSIPELVPWDSWRIGLSAVIEAEDGTLSYWALAHPKGAPDFHHPDCFALELPPPERI